MAQEQGTKKKYRKRQNPADKPELRSVLERLKACDPEEVLTIPQAVELTGFTTQSFYNWIKSKRRALRAVRPGREWLMKVGDLYEYLSNRNLHDEDEAAENAPERQRGILAVHPGRNLKPSASPTAARPNLQLAPRVSQASEEAVGFSSREEAFQLVALLILQSDLVIRWRRSYLTLAAARAGEDQEWTGECERDLRESEEMLLHASKWSSKALVNSLYNSLSATALPSASLRMIERDAPIETLLPELKLDHEQLDAITEREITELFESAFSRPGVFRLDSLPTTESASHQTNDEALSVGNHQPPTADEER